MIVDIIQTAQIVEIVDVLQTVQIFQTVQTDQLFKLFKLLSLSLDSYSFIPTPLLSNSNPTLNPTWTNLNKLEQDGFGVDFVFSCHNNNKNNKKNLT